MKKNVIYFVLAEGANRVKIGLTDNPSRRLSCRTDCPYPMRLLCTIPESMFSERRMHYALRQYRVHREWFHASAVVLRIAELLGRGGSAAASAITWLERRTAGFVERPKKPDGYDGVSAPAKSGRVKFVISLSADEYAAVERLRKKQPVLPERIKVLQTFIANQLKHFGELDSDGRLTPES